MKSTLVVGLCLAASITFAQYAHDKGYFINNNGERVECLIRRLDGAYNPKKLEYKLNDKSNPIVLNVSEVSEFGVTGEAVFVRATVDIDRSGSNVNKLSQWRNPEWSNETVFLKVLVKGQANLYLYKEDGLTRFFFNTVGSNIEQLVYKPYLSKANQMAYNKLYLQQLQQSLKCDKMPQKIDVPYQLKPLVNIFLQFNKCVGIETEVQLAEKKAPVTLSISIRPGVNYSIFTSTASVGNQEFRANFKSKATFRAGAEYELYPSFNNRNKRWSVVVEPNYRNYSDEFTEANQTYRVKYSSIEIPIGLRRYFYLSDSKAIFLNVFLLYDFPVGDSGGKIPTNFITNYVFEYTFRDNWAGYAAGIGFMARRFFGETRFYSNRNPTKGFASIASNFSNVALVFGYRLVR